METLRDNDLIVIGLRFANLEKKLGEIDRARWVFWGFKW